MLARVVGESLLREHLVRPRTAIVDRERGRAVPERPPSGQPLDCLDGRAHVGGELRAGLRVHGEVGVAVTRDLVAAAGDATHQLRMGARRHPQDEEGRLHSQLVEEPEQRAGLAGQSGSRFPPVRRPYAPANELVPVLEIDAQKQCLAVIRGGHRPAQVLIGHVDCVR